MPKVADRFWRIKRFAVLMLPLLLTVEMEANDWPQWRGPNRDNVWNETGILQTFPAEGLKICWRVPVWRR